MGRHYARVEEIILIRVLAVFNEPQFRDPRWNGAAVVKQDSLQTFF